jgi:hypothetical protein
MQFLYPNFLWALFALAIPIAIHLFNFKRYKTVYFSNVAFLQNIQKETKSQSTLKKILLLILRLLLLASLVIAFARPYWPESQAGKIDKSSWVVLYIDNSFSMEAEGSGGILLEDAKMKAQQLVASFSFNTKFLFVDNTFNPLHMQWVSNEQLTEFISHTSASHIYRTINQVFDRVSLALPKTDSTMAVRCFLLSDFQEGAINGTLNIPENCKTYALPLENNTRQNLSIDSVWFESPGHYKGKSELLHVLIHNYGTTNLENIPLQLYLNDTLKNTLTFSVSAKKSEMVPIPFTQWHAGNKRLRIELNDFPITFDNSFYFNYSLNEKNNILLIQDAHSQPYFSTLYTDINFGLTKVNYKAIPYSGLSKYQLIVLNELEQISTGLITELQTFVGQGGALLIIPSRKCNLDSYNLFLNKTVGLSFENWLDQKGTLKILDANNPLLESAFTSKLKDARLPDYTGFYPVKKYSRSPVSTILETESGNDAFLMANYGLGTIYIHTSPLQPEFSNMGTHPLFVPLFYNLALQSTQAMVYYYILNPQTKIQLPGAAYTGGNLSLTKSNSSETMMPRAVFSKGAINLFPEIEKLEAGFYTIADESVPVAQCAFNYNRNESVTDYYSQNELEALFNSGTNHSLSFLKTTDNKLTDTLYTSFDGKDLSTWFLLAVLLLFMVELLIVRYLY